MANANYTVVIMRGCSGSGKSHYACGLLRCKSSEGITACICSADTFFSSREFDPSLLGRAHSECMHSFINALSEGMQCIIVDNTNTEQWEYYNYVSLAETFGYKVEIVEMIPQTIDELRICVERNQHAVPMHVIVSQTMRFESSPRAKKIGISR